MPLEMQGCVLPFWIPLINISNESYCHGCCNTLNISQGMLKIVFYLVSYYKRLKTNAQNCTYAIMVRFNWMFVLDLSTIFELCKCSILAHILNSNLAKSIICTIRFKLIVPVLKYDENQNLWTFSRPWFELTILLALYQPSYSVRDAEGAKN